jgi:hypothetical protein
MAIERLMVVGNSHAFALKKGHRLQSKKPVLNMNYAFALLNQDIFRPPFCEDDEGHVELNASLLELLDTFKPDAIVSIVGGHHHNVIGLTNPTLKFDFILPENPYLPLDTDADFIPYSVISELLASRNSESWKTLSALKATSSLPIIHLELPPPIPDEDFLRANGGRFAAVMEEQGISPVSFRFKLWRANCDANSKTCKTLEIPYIPVPTSTQNEDGTLRREFWSDDPVHANADYGITCLAAAENFISRTFQEES